MNYSCQNIPASLEVRTQNADEGRTCDFQVFMIFKLFLRALVEVYSQLVRLMKMRNFEQFSFPL
jgi:hypothetical protein